MVAAAAVAQTAQRLATFIKVVGVVCWICSNCLVSTAQSELPDNDVALWSVRLLPDLSQGQRGTYNLGGVSFLDDGRLIVYAVVHDLSRFSARESPEVGSPFRLHVWVVDGNTGKTEAHKEWGTRVHDSAVQVTAGGVLVKTGGVIRLYSPDFAQTRDLPFTLDPNGNYFTSVSASGHTIVIGQYLQKEHAYVTHLYVLDAETLKIRDSWEQYPPVSRFSISDVKLASTQNGRVVLTEFGHARRNVGTLYALKLACPSGIGGPALVSDELIALRDCNEVLLLTPSGVSYTLDTFDGSNSTETRGGRCEPYNPGIASKLVVASGAQFVAFTLPVLTTRKPLLAEWRTCLDGLKVGVYDLTLKKRAATLSIDPLPKSDYGVALSRDGSRLAVLNDRNLSVHSVPILAKAR
jgi:hypothetical protein